jgi:hypothetical protein
MAPHTTVELVVLCHPCGPGPAHSRGSLPARSRTRGSKESVTEGSSGLWSLGDTVTDNKSRVGLCTLFYFFRPSLKSYGVIFFAPASS